MNQDAIFGPVIGMFALTFAVWFYMYVRRLHFMQTKRIHPQKLTTPVQADALIPDEIHYASFNLKNLFELPVLFYAACTYLFVTGQVDSVHVTAAWLFFGFRVIHSIIHCSINHVVARFTAYQLAAFSLWVIIGRIIVSAVT